MKALISNCDDFNETISQEAIGLMTYKLVPVARTLLPQSTLKRSPSGTSSSIATSSPRLSDLNGRLICTVILAMVLFSPAVLTLSSSSH